MTGAAGQARIILATRNPGKLAELRRILAAAEVGVTVDDLQDVPDMPEVAETGRTFRENALLKARAVAAFTGLPAVADDSGLCVDALNGMPGVLSARWSGSHGDDEANLRLLLAQLADVPAGQRGARFVCVAALVLPSGGEHLAEGEVLGQLAGIPGRHDDPGLARRPRHRPSASSCRRVSSAQPATPRSSSRSSSSRPNGSRSAVPWISTKPPSPVQTTFMSVSAAESSS